jgi:hypothetical protein
MRGLVMGAALGLALLFAAYAVGLRQEPRTAQAAAFPAAQLSSGLLFECLPGNAISVRLAWGSSGQGLQWVDLSQHNDNFAQESYQTIGPLSPTQSQVIWDFLSPATWYFVRVNTLVGDTWHPSDTMLFYTPNECVFEAPSQPSVPASSSPARCSALPVDRLAGCVWNRPEQATYGVGQALDFCYFVTQPADLLIIVRKPDGTSLVVLDGFANATGACLGPFRADVPLGQRSLELYDRRTATLLDSTTFSVR